MVKLASASQGFGGSRQSVLTNAGRGAGNGETYRAAAPRGARRLTLFVEADQAALSHYPVEVVEFSGTGKTAKREMATSSRWACSSG